MLQDKENQDVSDHLSLDDPVRYPGEVVVVIVVLPKPVLILCQIDESSISSAFSSPSQGPGASSLLLTKRESRPSPSRLTVQFLIRAPLFGFLPKHETHSARNYAGSRFAGPARTRASFRS